MADRRRSTPNGEESTRTYESPESEIYERDTVMTTGTIPTTTNTAVNLPVDRIRWGSIIAGLFAALATLVVLSVLGLAIGLSNYNPGDPLRNFGIGAGIWGAVSTLIAFFIGGWLAAGTVATRGRGNGMLNGAMVWIVTIPLLLYVAGNSLGSILSTASSTVAGAAGPAAAAAATQPQAQATGQGLANAAQATATVVAGQLASPSNQQAIANAGSSTAWGTLTALLVGLIAAALGGLVGARRARYAPTVATVSS